MSFAPDLPADSTAVRLRLASSQASSSMAAEVGENAIDIALKVARALSAVGADYFLASFREAGERFGDDWRLCPSSVAPGPSPA
jgi:hypothetical protein